MLNFWDAQAQPFPVVSPKAGGAAATSPVETFPPNGYGLHDMTGNAWQWVAGLVPRGYFPQPGRLQLIENPSGRKRSYDMTIAGAPVNAPRRVIRGGLVPVLTSITASATGRARAAARSVQPHVAHRLFASWTTADAWKTSR